MGFAKPIEQYLFGNLLTEIQVFMYLKDIIRGEANMKLRNILIVVKDIERARKYYHDLFGLDILLLCYSNRSQQEMKGDNEG